MGARKETAARIAWIPASLFAIAIGGCDRPAPAVPSAEVVKAYYSIPAGFSVTMRGNVAELSVQQSGHQLERGGTIWARVGPYVYLFSEATRDVLTEHPGLAGVRVVTRDPRGREVARATLARDELSALTWKRALHIAGLARRDGTKMPTRLEDLIRWGEDHTDYRYSSAWVHAP